MVPAAPAIAAAVDATVPVLVAMTAVDVVAVAVAVMTAAIVASAPMPAAMVPATVMTTRVMAPAAVAAAMMAATVMTAAVVAPTMVSTAMLGDCRSREHESRENRGDQGELAKHGVSSTGTAPPRATPTTWQCNDTLRHSH